VTASLEGWPGADELPLPQLQQEQHAAAPVFRAASTGVRRPPAARLPDEGLEDDSVPLLGLVDVDLFSRWPGVTALPVPPQQARVARAEPVQEVAAVTVGPEEQGVSSIDLTVPGVLGMFLALLMTHRRGRAGMLALGGALRFGVLHPMATRLLLARQAARGIALMVRLTLGLLGMLGALRFW
jgi:hypothetical protein